MVQWLVTSLSSGIVRNSWGYPIMSVFCFQAIQRKIKCPTVKQLHSELSFVCTNIKLVLKFYNNSISEICLWHISEICFTVNLSLRFQSSRLNLKLSVFSVQISQMVMNIPHHKRHQAKRTCKISFLLIISLAHLWLNRQNTF